MAAKYESMKIIGDRLLRNTIMKGISWESIIDYSIDFMEIVGIPDIYEDKLYECDIEYHRAELPCDYIEEKLVTINNRSATYATDPMHNHYDKIGSATNILTYTINNNFLFASVPHGKLKLNYLAFMVDEEGYPKLPADRNFLLALEWYIKQQYFTMLWENGQLEDKRLENAKQEYAWAVGRLQTSSHMLSLGKAEALFNSFRTLIPRDNEFTKRFGNTGAKEYLKSI